MIICLIATKACYIKFAGLVKALKESETPFIAIETGQHYEPFLRNAADELVYRDCLHGEMVMPGNLVKKSSVLAANLFRLHCELQEFGCRNAVLAVCGDTVSAGTAPYAWYLATGERSIHIESGLRSMRPRWDWCKDLIDQRSVPWESEPTRPFPEGICTRMATLVSQLLFAPVARNERNLVREGYEYKSIHVSGSPSVDAVRAAIGVLNPGRHRGANQPRIRVDVHRRENLTPERLGAIFSGLNNLADTVPIELVLTKTMQGCEGLSWDNAQLEPLREKGISVTLQTESYASVIDFLTGPECLAIYTDSGGLQEECCILGVPCMTCRFDTDRPETVLEFGTNILIPPKDPSFISEGIQYCLEHRDIVWTGLEEGALKYGSAVGKGIVDKIASFDFARPTETSVW